MGMDRSAVVTGCSFYHSIQCAECVSEKMAFFRSLNVRVEGEGEQTG